MVSCSSLYYVSGMVLVYASKIDVTDIYVQINLVGHGYWEGRVVLWRRVNNNVAQDSKLALTEPASKNLILYVFCV